MRKSSIFFTVVSFIAFLPWDSTKADQGNDMSSLISYNLEAKSLSNIEQSIAIYTEIMKEKDSEHTNTESYQILNDRLKAMALPQFNPLLPSFKIVATYASSALSKKDPVVGFEIEDDSHIFCFPCKRGYGNYRFGILKK